MTALLYRWPPTAVFGRVIPKSKFYEHGSLSRVLRQKVVDEVLRVTWSYKLSETTINLRADSTVHEIQVFTIHAKDTDVSDAVLGFIDKTVRSPIIFEIVEDGNRGGKVRMTATLKQLGGGTPKLSDYYTTSWQHASAERRPLPSAVTLPALYTALLAPLIPLECHPGEEVPGVAARLEAVRSLRREIAALEHKLRTELQLNRKVEFRRALQLKRFELEQVSNSGWNKSGVPNG